MDYPRNYISGHFQPKLWVPDIICLLKALTARRVGEPQSTSLNWSQYKIRILRLPGSTFKVCVVWVLTNNLALTQLMLIVIFIKQKL